MSRTYRLKKNKLPNWDNPPWEREHKEPMRWLHRYFGDTHPGQRQSTPKAERKEFAKTTGMRNKEELRKALLDEDYVPISWKERIVMGWGWD